MESVSGAEGTIWPMFSPPATWAVCAEGGQCWKNGGRGKHEGFMNLKMNAKHLPILKKKICTSYIPESTVGSLYYFPLKS